MADQLQLAFVNFKKDTYIIIEGKQNADRFFIIKEGRIRITKEAKIVEEDGDLGPGDFFGVVSTMSSHNHIETAQAVTDVTLISIQRDQYGQLIQNNSAVAVKIITQFSKHLRFLDATLSRLTLKRTVEADSSHLYEVAEYYAKQSQFNLAYFAYQKYIKHCPRGPEINQARMRMMKIAPYVKSPKLDFEPDEFNRAYPKDSMLFAEGEPGDELYILHRGSVKISKIVDNNEVLLGILKNGDIFGEMALLESKPRTASAVAHEDCMVLAVNRANFSKMIETQPQIIARLTTILAERIWFAYKQLSNACLTDPLGRMFDNLLIQLERDRIPLNAGMTHIFDFGLKELVSMVGLGLPEGGTVLKEMLKNRNLRLLNEKIYVTDVMEIVRQSQYYRKMQSRSQNLGHK